MLNLHSPFSSVDRILQGFNFTTTTVYLENERILQWIVLSAVPLPNIP